MQLNKTDRKEIAFLLNKGYGIRNIGKIIRRSPSVISREIKRNSTEKIYDPEKADHKRYTRRKYCNFQHSKIPMNKELQDYIENKLKLGWSPEKIAGRWNMENKNKKIAFQRIYEWLQGIKPSLSRYLLRAKDKPKRRKIGIKRKKQLIPNRVWIDKRPKEADKRKEIGHFEGDTIVSQRGDKSVILTMVDRRSRYLLINKFSNKKAQPIAETIKVIVNNLNIKTVTLDNGIEFQKHKIIGCPTYFCHPYSSWEKGTIENINGLIRRYIPKNTRIKDISRRRLDEIAWRLNNTPKKCLGFLTPKEVHFALWKKST